MEHLVHLNFQNKYLSKHFPIKSLISKTTKFFSGTAFVFLADEGCKSVYQKLSAAKRLIQEKIESVTTRTWRIIIVREGDLSHPAHPTDVSYKVKLPSEGAARCVHIAKISMQAAEIIMKSTGFFAPIADAISGAFLDAVPPHVPLPFCYCIV